MDFALSGVVTGNLTYTFTSVLEITIANTHLVVPDVQVNDAGSTFIPEQHVRALLVYADPVTESDMPLLGQMYTTAADLHVNNDRQEFTMWQAQPTAKTDYRRAGVRMCAAAAQGKVLAAMRQSCQ